jgi:hypothetical protein
MEESELKPASRLGQFDPKKTAFARLRLDAEFSAHSLNSLTHDRQPKPVPS